MAHSHFHHTERVKSATAAGSVKPKRGNKQQIATAQKVAQGLAAALDADEYDVTISGSIGGDFPPHFDYIAVNVAAVPTTEET